jgi:hypothetical protein
MCGVFQPHLPISRLRLFGVREVNPAFDALNAGVDVVQPFIVAVNCDNEHSHVTAKGVDVAAHILSPFKDVSRRIGEHVLHGMTRCNFGHRLALFSR